MGPAAGRSRSRISCAIADPLFTFGLNSGRSRSRIFGADLAKPVYFQANLWQECNCGFLANIQRKLFTFRQIRDSVRYVDDSRNR
nr:MAG TPA: hypothetical protein [Caudoviricetes sp.]